MPTDQDRNETWLRPSNSYRLGHGAHSHQTLHANATGSQSTLSYCKRAVYNCVFENTSKDMLLMTPGWLDACVPTNQNTQKSQAQTETTTKLRKRRLEMKHDLTTSALQHCRIKVSPSMRRIRAPAHATRTNDSRMSLPWTAAMCRLRLTCLVCTCVARTSACSARVFSHRVHFEI